MSQARSPDPLYAGPRQGGPNVSNGAGARPNGLPAVDSGSLQSRAERFEDEKRRIIESCFSKREPDGSLFESYITHVRVVEDAMYPSSPPPPDSGASNKKHRVILVAVRKTGRVRVHKARENASGTFSIGKTWPLDDLSGIQNFVGLVPVNTHEQQAKQWASNLGFIVTLGKPYYWQTSTSKEKDFFIASLVKIFRKYTGGKLPELVGFSSEEIQQLTGTPTPRAPSGFQTPSQTPVLATSTPVRPVSPELDRAVNESQPQSRSIGVAPIELPDTAAQRSGSRPRTRDGHRITTTENIPPQLPAETPTPRREEFRVHSRDVSRQQPAVEPSIPGRPSQDGPIATSNRSASSTPRPSISPRSSHSSLQPDQPISSGYNYKTSALQPPPIPNEAALRKLGVAPSLESVRTGDTASSAQSRPSTAASDRRTPAFQEGILFSGDKLPHMREFSNSKTEQGPDKRSIHGEVTTPREDGLTATSGQKDYFVTPPTEPESDQTANGAATVESKPSTKGDQLSAEKTVESSSLMNAEPREADQVDTKPDEEHRPGLGPMVKKKSAKDLASTLRRAALAATAFQPRQGGAAARFRAQQEKKDDEPDGITSVVPAPLLRGMSGDSARSGGADIMTPGSEKDRPVSPVSIPHTPKVQIQRTATGENALSSQTMSTTATANAETVTALSPEKARDRSPERRRRQRQEADIEKYCTSLGLDPKVADGRGGDFNDLLSEFGWEGKLPDHKKLDDFEADVRREVGRAQATGWLGHVEQQEGKIQELSKAFEKAIEECEELDGLLTLYAHELDTLHDDIQYIEAQSQGLQVQTANQKLLQKELRSLLQTLNVSSSDLRGMHTASLEDPDGISALERSLLILYQAMVTIDPEIRQNKLRRADNSSRGRNDVGIYADTELGQMRAVRQKKDDYRNETSMFLKRFGQYMTNAFKLADQRTSDENSRTSVSNSVTSLNSKSLSSFRNEMWIYNGILLFVREVNSYEWNLLIHSYEINVKSTYQEQFNEDIANRKKAVRPPTGDEPDVLFSSQEKDDKHETGFASATARKLTVKRGKTVKATALRLALSEKKGGRLHPWEIFDAVVQGQSKVISEEQNFIVDFFHLNSQASTDFVELVSSRPPHQRKVSNLSSKHGYEPDRNMSKIIQNTIEGIYSFWPTDLQRLLDWCLVSDPLQGVGILCSLEQCLSIYEETNQEFITRILRMLHERVNGLFQKFLDEQVKAIEETKVKVKKRKGIVLFIRVFPLFCATIEGIVSSAVRPGTASHESLEIRFIINDAYTRILKAMWECLNFIAIDDPASNSTGVHSNTPVSGDPEDKEALNYHISLIENMNYFIEELDSQRNVVLEEWNEKASHDLFTHLTRYTDAVIRRPLGKWLDFLESTEALMKSSDNPTSVASKPSHSRSAAKKVLNAYDGKEMRKGVETLKKRIEKHFSDAEEHEMSSSLGSQHPGQSKGLVTKVFEECSSRYLHAWDRMKAIIDQVYGGELEIEWRKEEASALFRR